MKSEDAFTREIYKEATLNKSKQLKLYISHPQFPTNTIMEGGNGKRKNNRSSHKKKMKNLMKT